MLRYKFIVTGRVQGVFFRKFTKQKADELSISGWCRNSSDGLSVEGEVEGHELPVKTMLRWLQEEGSPHSSIDKWDMELLDSSDMAGQAAKKVARNAQTKSIYYSGAAVVATIMQCMHQFIIMQDVSLFGITKTLFLLFVSWLSYKMILGALNMGVGYELWLDLFVINTFVQVFSIWTSYIWLLYLAVPGYGLYHVGGYIKSWIFARRDEVSNEADGGRQQKQKIKYRR